MSEVWEFPSQVPHDLPGFRAEVTNRLRKLTNFLKQLSAPVGTWVAWTGTADRSTENADASTTASVGYVQAELQAVNDRLVEQRQAFKALLDDLTSKGILG